MPVDDENAEPEQTRDVAIQNASILAARQRAEDTLRKQSDWLRTTLASIGDAVISTDAASSITFMNGVAETLTGWSQVEGIGRPLPEVFHIVNEGTREVAENPVLRALREGAVIGLASHTILIARDGTERPIDHSAAPIQTETGESTGAVLVFRDTSSRKNAEEALALHAAIIESSDDAIISKTLDGIVRSWNAGAERLFGYSANEMIGRSITIVIPLDRRDEEYEILARISRGERVEHFETIRVTKDGCQIAISLTVSPIRNLRGVIIGASKIARDITMRKRAEEVLKEEDRRKDQFIALLAHELRNPLAPLRSGLEIMRLASGDAHAVSQARNMMERQLGHMVRLIDDLLDISRITQNKMELRRSRILLTDAINSAIETARPSIEAAGHQFTVSMPSQPIRIDADLTRLAQVFSNLLTNSAKYTEQGGQIWLTVSQNGGEAIISIRDTGIGIPRGDLARIFEMFSQVDRSTERSTGGLGIGLALVKGLVEMHHGTVNVESEGQGRGSTFTVRLPVLPDHDDTPIWSHPEPDEFDVSGRLKILVVDDNRDGAMSMAMLLQAMKYDVRTAHDGFEGIEVAEKYRPDVILMDLGMPHLNGYEATQRIRQHPWSQGMRIFAMTGWGSEQDRIRSKEAGCDGHIIKPVTPEELRALMMD